MLAKQNQLSIYVCSLFNAMLTHTALDFKIMLEC